MSVALDAQGDTVPNRGDTKIEMVACASDEEVALNGSP